MCDIALTALKACLWGDNVTTISIMCTKPTIDNGNVSPDTALIGVGDTYTIICSNGYSIFGTTENGHKSQKNMILPDSTIWLIKITICNRDKYSTLLPKIVIFYQNILLT